ncbi:OmpA family protein [Neiella sp. HB171785]|uniref:OmpA family protein n=1 Tax=Neiella litorisoli TaxID=2771431 RepID=A0A8J6QM24_9GAMM|nr:OmpA family protein [Neiella litorisoli]MBD1390611.1 OmpA family protein [Neiella litorisoli]
MSKPAKLLSIVALSISAVLNSTSVQADEGYRYYVGGQIGHAEMDSAHQHESGASLQRGPMFGGQFGIQPFSNDHWELRFRADYSELDVEDISDDESAWWYALDALYFFNEDYNYVFAGPHYEDFDSDEQAGAHIGVGARYYFTDNWALTGEVQGLYGFDESSTDFVASIGLLYFFGQQGAATTAADDDRDGVNNNLDKCPDTPLGHSVDAQGCTRFYEQAIVKQVTILFAHDDATVPARSYNNVAEIAEFMAQHPQLDIVIEGHTSLVGSATYNQKLSERRADAVKQLLIERYQVAEQRISALGYGETRPAVSPEQNADDAAANRRIMVEMNASKRTAITNDGQ